MYPLLTFAFYKINGFISLCTKYNKSESQPNNYLTKYDDKSNGDGTGF